MKRPIAELPRRNARRKDAARETRNPPVTRSISTARGWVTDDRGSLVIAGVIWFSIVYLIVPPEDYSGHLNTLESMTEPNVLFRAIKLLLISASCLVILWRGGLAWLLIQSTNRLFLVCLTLIPLSFLWSIDQSATIARIVTLSSIVFVCYAFVLVGWHSHRFQNVVRPIVTLLLAASLIFGMVFPDLAIETGDGASLKDAWRGLTSQKNQFGLLASIGAVFWLHALLTRETKVWLATLGLLISSSCVLLSRSSSSLLSTILTAAFMLVLLYIPRNLRRYMPYIVGTLSTIVVIYTLAVLKLVPGLDALLTPIAEFFGKDLTFSNRSEIWLIIKEHIQLRPLLGSGFGAYWVGPVPTSPSYEFLARMYFYPTESHNGYLEIVNDLGFVGLICFLGYLVVFIRQALKLMRVERNQGILYLCIFFQQAVGNLSESYWLQIGFGFTVVTLATFSVARAFLDIRLQQYFGAGNRGTPQS